MPNRPPDYLVIGHVTKDLQSPEPGSTPGGTALYSALAAQRLGLQAAMVTAYAQEDEALVYEARDAGVWVYGVDSPGTTTFHNAYDAKGGRRQTLIAQASPIGYVDIPDAWLDAPIVHLGPVAQELPQDLPSRFTRALLGLTPQGWMRSWDSEGKVYHSAWPVPQALAGLPLHSLLALSIEDLGHGSDLLAYYAGLAPLVAVTQGQGDTYLYSRGGCSMVATYPAEVIDPTGAGDVFAAALLVRYHETGDLEASARFANAAAACSVEGHGTSAIPDRKALVQKQRRY